MYYLLDLAEQKQSANICIFDYKAKIEMPSTKGFFLTEGRI